jgi:serine/threonine protein kinase/Flp pilus assembly protein TadD
MNPHEDLPSDSEASAKVVASGPVPTLEDPRMISAVQEYLAELEAGHKPDHRAFLASHPEIAAALAECLDGLEFLRAAAPRLQEPDLGRPAVASSASSAIEPEGPLGDFRIVREIGRGGMGVVCEAVQISLGRRVALKVLPFAAAMDPKQLQRFKNEAQAAAHLHHTNIVPVFGVGCERGIHFYAMQLIEGQTLAAVIRELRQLTGIQPVAGAGSPSAASGLVRSLLSGDWPPASRNGADLPPTTDYVLAPPTFQTLAVDTTSRPGTMLSSGNSTKSPVFFRTVAHLGVQAAEALEHAHQLGVIHRDIKPSNLMVDARGSLWITDFGLAQIQGDPGMTMTGDLVGTVRYMSPEQARGKRYLMDHRVDVYSLGTTLYELLTLEPAFGGHDRQAILRRIAEEEPRSPTRLNPALPTDLETVVLKAMAKEQEGRYATAKELADDLRRFLEDKPIRAKRPSLRQRATKWARRHKAVVRATVVGLVVAVAGLSVSTFLTTAAYRAEAEQRRAAQAEYKRADENLRLGLQALDEFCLALLEEPLPDHPQIEPRKQKLLQKALQHYTQFTEKNSDNLALRQQTGQAYKRIGDIHYLRGHYPEAETAYRAAINYLKPLAENFPDVPEYRQKLSGCYTSLGSLLKQRSKFEQAEKAYGQAIVLSQQLVSDFPDVADYRQGLARVQNNLGNLFLFTHRFPDAQKAYGQAVTLSQELVRDSDTEADFRQLLAISHYNLGILLAVTGRMQEAATEYQQALVLQRKLANDLPDTPNYKQDLARSLNKLGNVHLDTSKFVEAKAAFDEALRLQKQLAAEFPAVPVYREDLARTHEELGALLQATNCLDEAEEQVGKALLLHQKLATQFPNVPTYQRDLARSLMNLGITLQSRGRLLEAEERYGQAKSHFLKLMEDFPTVRKHLAQLYLDLGDLMRDANRHHKAEESYREAVLHGRKLVNDFPNVVSYQGISARALHGLARLLYDRNELMEARQLLEEAIQRQESVLKANSQASFSRDDLRQHYALLAQTLLRLKDHAELARVAIQLRRVSPNRFRECCHAAHYLARCMVLAKDDARLSDDKRKELTGAYGEQAVQLFRETIHKGLQDLESLLCPREDVQKLQRALKERPQIVPDDW